MRGRGEAMSAEEALRDPSTAGLLTRDGHLTELSLERRTLDDLASHEVAAVDAHLAACQPCARRYALLQDDEAPPLPASLQAAIAGASPPSGAPPPAAPTDERAAPVAVPPAEPPAGATVISLAARRRRWAVGGASALALAAGLLLALRRPPPSPVAADPAPDEVIRLKGSDLALEVYRDDGVGGEALFDGAPIAAGDRVGFRYRARRPGFLVVLGVDPGGHAYPIYPQGAGDGAVAVVAGDAFVTVDASLRFDDAPGTERVVAVLCDAPLALADASRIAVETAPPGCAREQLHLVKRAAP